MSEEKAVRIAKMAIVDEIQDKLTNAESVIVTEYRGMTVDALSDLRRGLRTGGGKYKVYKNTLARRAADGAGTDTQFTELLIGPTALAFTDVTPEGDAGDVVNLAKTLRDFAKTNPNLVIKGGLFEGGFIDADGLKQLADVEPREVLLAKLAGLMAAPMQQFAGLLQAVPQSFAYGLKALIEAGGAPGAPESAPAEAEAPAEETAPPEAAPAEEASEVVAEEAAVEEAPTEEPAPEPAEQDTAVAEEAATESTEETPAEASAEPAEATSEETESE